MSSSESAHWSDSTTHQTWSGPLPQSANDDRQYRLIRLRNGLQAMLVSDAAADKAAIACNVGVGSMADSLPGMAHAIEHCKFLGTEKYPSENEYNTYLSANGGNSNAYTGAQNTGYYLDVHPSALEGAVDRFAQFFVAPLFSEGSIEREMNAVDSEHKKNLQQDPWRSQELSKKLSKPKHPYNAFATGDYNTLYREPIARGLKPRSEFLKWHAENYSANIMAVAIVGNQSLQDLERMIVSNFSAVKDSALSKRQFDPELWGPNEKGTLVFQETITDIRSMSIDFILPDLQQYLSSRPDDVLSHLMGHEGPGSLCAHLRKTGLVNSVSAGGYLIANGFTSFSISLDLTEEGFVKYQHVASALFSYINLIKSDLDRESTFREIRDINKLDFTFKEKARDMSRFVDVISRNMLMDWPRERLLDSSVARAWEPEIFEHILESLTPANCRITISATKPPPDLPAPDKVEPIYNSKYSYNKIEPSFLAALNAPPKIAELKMPLPNPYIPTNLDVLAKKKSKCPLTEPALIYSDKYCELYHKTDDRWLVPRANVKIQFFNPQMSETVEDVVKSALVVELLKDKLAVETYDADLAGLSYSMSSSGDCIHLDISGYNDKLPVLLRNIVEVSKTIQFEQDRFRLMVDQFTRAWQNVKYSSPYELVRDAHMELTLQREYEHNIEAKLSALKSITVAQVQAQLQTMFSHSHAKVLTHGNLDQSSSLAILETLQDEYKFEKGSKLVKARGRYPLRNINMIVQQKSKNNGETNSAIFFTSFVGLYQDCLERAKNMLYVTLVKEPFFDTLRTKEQLGYIVAALPRNTDGTVWTAFLIQSERDPVYLHERIRHFVTSYREQLSALPADEFGKTRDSLIAQLLETPKNMADETERFWAPIARGYNNFTDKEEQAKLLEKMTKQDMLDFHDKYVQNPNGTKRLVMHWNSISEPEVKEADPAASGSAPLLEENKEGKPQVIDYSSAEYVEFLASLGVAPQPEAMRNQMSKI